MAEKFYTYDLKFHSHAGGPNMYRISRNTTDQDSDLFIVDRNGMTFQLPSDMPSPESIKDDLTRSLNDLRKARLDETTDTSVSVLTNLEDVTLRVDKIETFGKALFNVFISSEERGVLTTKIHTWSAAKINTQVRINLTDTPELAKYAWEALHMSVPGQGTDIQFAIEPKTTISRILAIGPRSEPFPNGVTQFRVLIAVAEPESLGEVGDRAEIKSIVNHLELRAFKSGQKSLFTHKLLPAATSSKLIDTVKDYKPHIIHYIGHSLFKDSKGYVCLHNPNDPKQHSLIEDKKFAKQITAFTPFLVVLNSCEGAQSDTSNPYAGLAQELISKGVSYVVAMQHVISAKAANAFSDGFYQSLVDNDTVAQAVSHGRAKIESLGPPNDIEFITPVLYTVENPPLLILAPSAEVDDALPDSGITNKQLDKAENQNEAGNNDAINVAVAAGAAAGAAAGTAAAAALNAGATETLPSNANQGPGQRLLDRLIDKSIDKVIGAAALLLAGYFGKDKLGGNNPINVRDIIIPSVLAIVSIGAFYLGWLANRDRASRTNQNEVPAVDPTTGNETAPVSPLPAASPAMASNQFGWGWMKWLLPLLLLLLFALFALKYCKPTPAPVPPLLVTCWDDSEAESQALCPKKVTCWDGSFVKNASACPAESVTCWDGSTANNLAACPLQPAPEPEPIPEPEPEPAVPVDPDFTLPPRPTTLPDDHIIKECSDVLSEQEASNCQKIISEIQQKLKEQGYYSGTIDGSYGPLTHQSYLDFAREQGVSTNRLTQASVAALGIDWRGPFVENQIPQITCWDGSIVADSADCDLKPTYSEQTCWDGSIVASSELCPVEYYEPPKIDRQDFNINVSDRDSQPLVRIPPLMPSEALVSGHCEIIFDVSEEGQPFDVKATYCTSEMFACPAIDSAKKWKFNPKIIDGVAVTRKGASHKVKFKVTDDSGNPVPEHELKPVYELHSKQCSSIESNYSDSDQDTVSGIFKRNGAPYFSAKIGVFENGSGSSNTKIDNPETFHLAAGYDFPGPLRTEISYHRRSAELDISNINPDWNLPIKVKSESVLLIGYYHFDSDWDFSPFVKAGIGLSNNSTDATVNTQTNDIEVREQSTDNLSWLLGAGVEIPIYSDWKIDLEYNYIDAGTILDQASTSSGMITDHNLAGHEITIGARYKF